MLSSILMVAGLLVAQQDAQAALADPVDDKCVLASIFDIQVPAEEAGALVSLEVKEGMNVKAGMELGKIDYREAETELQVRKYDFEVAEFKAKSKVAVEYARKAAEVAKTVYDKYELANKDEKGGSRKTVALTELLRFKLEWEKARVTIDKELEEIQAAALTSKGKGAELEAARVSLGKRTLRSPIDGKVVRVLRAVGEWVAPGDTVFRIVSVDRLKIVSNLDANQYGPSDVQGRAVTVEVSLPRNRKEKFDGKVVSVSPLVGVGLKLPVTVEFDVPMEKGEPVVRAGQRATITIHLNERAVPAAARSEPTRLGKRNN